MQKEEGLVPETPKESADDLSSINQEEADHSQSMPGDERSTSGPSVGDAFRGGS